MSVFLAVWGFLKTGAGKIVAIAAFIIGALGVAYFRGRASGGQNQRNKDRRKLDRAKKEQRKDEIDIRRSDDGALDSELRKQRDHLP